MTPQDFRAIRKVVGLNLQQVALLVGCTPSYICMIEKGDRRLTPQMERKLSDALNVTPELLALMAEFERERSKVAQ